MVKRIVWTQTAIQELEETLDYWKKNNQSTTYPKKILGNLKYVLRLLKKHPHLGLPTDYPNVCARTFMSHFQIIYSVRQDAIFILSFWDSRQDPESNRYT
ncbi:type II toxin-antitoxin system RelE/ParE family toxin [Marinoscillum sp.]|uniref:type II toxin-antitoxin system RelE/ParE family toxin n=1 Tax=Marinoscillum sp. TaxID=2024838 RepID=UPI003BAC6D4B